MKTASYALAGAICAERGLAAEYGPADKDGNKPLLREAVKITTPEAENVGEFLTLMEDGKEEHMLKLAQGQLDIIRQRKIREAAEDSLTAAILDGKTEVELDVDIDGLGSAGDKVSTADLSEADRREVVRLRCQAIGDSYIYGSARAASGAGKATKEKAAKQTKLQEAVAAGALTEAEIEKLKAIGAL